MPRQYPKELTERAVRLVTESLDEHDTQWSTIRQVATRLGVGQETLRKWLRQAEVNSGVRPGVSESENVEIRRVKKEVVELRRTNDTLRTASAFFTAEPDRLQTE